MDPIECLRLLLDNLVSASDTRSTEVNRSNCKRRAAEHARGLADWLERDGFAPNIARTLAGVSPGGYGYVVGGAS